jgi:hypothetical protein
VAQLVLVPSRQNIAIRVAEVESRSSRERKNLFCELSSGVFHALFAFERSFTKITISVPARDTGPLQKASRDLPPSKLVYGRTIICEFSSQHVSVELLGGGDIRSAEFDVVDFAIADHERFSFLSSKFT